MKIRGIDTLEFGIKIRNYDKHFEKFLLELEELKNISQINRKNEIININNSNFEVYPKGQGFYRYKIQNNEVIICFAKCSVLNTPEIFVKFLSPFLWEYGYNNAFKIFLEWFEYFDSSIEEIKVSRLDICFDTDEIEFLETDTKKVCTRARKEEVNYVADTINYEGKIFTGFVIGKGSSLSCRIYNKTIEIKRSNKKWFEDIWKEFCWNGENTVWRIEFQIRRAVLKEFKINTVNDIDNMLDGLWAYLTQKWLIIKVKGKDKNTSRWKTDKRWIKVQKAEEDYLAKPTIREKIVKGDMEKLLNQTSGLLMSITAKGNYPSIQKTLEKVNEHMQQKQNAGKINIENEIEKRKNRYIKNS